MHKTIQGLKIFSLFSYIDYRKDYLDYKYLFIDNFIIFERLIDDYQIDIFFDDDCLFLPIKKSYHVDSLVRLVARKFCCPYFYCFDYVKKVHKNCFLDSNERYLNLRNALSVKALPSDMTYILFDDVVTSGATMIEMRRALIDFGIAKNRIFGLTFFGSYF